MQTGAADRDIVQAMARALPMTRMLTLFITVGAAAVAALVIVASPNASTEMNTVARASTRSVASVPRCASGLVVWLDTEGSGTAGSVYYKLKLTNLSGRRCALRGYPGVSAVGLTGRQLGSAATRNTHTSVRTVVLAPAGTASAVLQINDVGVFTSSLCRPVTAAGLRVYPPNATEAKLIPFPFRACSRSGRAYLHVEAVAPAAP